MSESTRSKSPVDSNNEDETIDVGTTSLTHLLACAEHGIDSSGSSEESSSRDMAVSQSHPVDRDNGEGMEDQADGDIHAQNPRTLSPKTFRELNSPPPDELVSSPTDNSALLYDNYQTDRKALTCNLCDYTTIDRTNLKRHKRLHVRSNPVNVLKCEKCVYTTILPRKIREHYRQQHNIIISCRQSECFEAPSSAYTAQHSQDNSAVYHNLDLSTRQPTATRTVPMPPSALHTLLTGPGRIEYARLQNPGLPPHYEPYETQPIPRAQETRMASNYLRSIVSTVLPPTPLHRVAATSTITSSSYYINNGVNSRRHMPPSSLHNPSLASMQAMDLQLDHGVKVKQEPVDMVMDTVSSSGVSTRSPEPARQIEPHTLQRQRLVEPPDSISYNMSGERSAEAVPSHFSNQPGVSDDSRRDGRRDSRYYDEPSGSQIQIKSEMSSNSIGVQCVMPVVKTEVVENKRRVRGTLLMIERGTQCELLQSSVVSGQSSGQAYGSDSESSEIQPVTHKPSSKCLHCGVTFDDEVIYSIHIGCHSHTDPYTCNVCGKQCHNKYGFYSHIMRGHHQC